MSRGTSFRIVITFLACVIVAGCTTGDAGIRAKAYFDDRQRVDQDMESGEYNYGYLAGKAVPEDRSEFKKTRKIYVLEVTKEVNQEVEPIIIERTRDYVPPSRDAQRKPEGYQPIVIPDLDALEETSPKPTTFEDYVIQKDDTLQKISKKHYGTYSMWLKIYDLNKDVIKDPNRIKPGMTIRIPVE